MRSFRAAEKFANERFANRAVDSALMYYDLTAAAVDSASTCMCLVLSAKMFISAMQQSEVGSAQQYAAKNAAVQTLASAVDVCKSTGPAIALPVFRTCISLLVKRIHSANLVKMLEAAEIAFLATATRQLLHFSLVFPTIALPRMLAFDSIYVSAVLRDLYKNILLFQGTNPANIWRLVLRTTFSRAGGKVGSRVYQNPTKLRLSTISFLGSHFPLVGFFLITHFKLWQ